MRGLLFSQMVPPNELLEEFHEWYDTEHVPSRLALRGFAAATRAEAAGDETRFLVTYELSDMAVLDTPEYDEIKRNPGERTARMLAAVNDFTRYTAETVWSSDVDTGTPAALVVHAIDASALDHGVTSRLVAAVESADGRPAASRSSIHRTIGTCVGPARTHLVIHELDHTDGLTSPLDTCHEWLDALAVVIGRIADGRCEDMRYLPFRHARSDWT